MIAWRKSSFELIKRTKRLTLPRNLDRFRKHRRKPRKTTLRGSRREARRFTSCKSVIDARKDDRLNILYVGGKTRVDKGKSETKRFISDKGILFREWCVRAREAKWTDKLSEKMSERQTAGLEPEAWRFSASSVSTEGTLVRGAPISRNFPTRWAERLSKPERFYSTEDFIGF